MFREITYKTPHSQNESKQTKRSKKMFEDCQKIIKQLQSELQYALQQNQEKDQIIKLLTEQKEYYEQQCRKSDEKMYPKFKEQLSFNQSLVNGLKQYNKQLTERKIILEQENKDLWEKCKEKDEILKITQHNIIKLQQEKSKLQREWSQTLKCVKNKIFQIQQENNTFDKIFYEKEIDKKRPLSRGGQKKNPHSKQQNPNLKQQKRKDSMNLPHQNRNDSKVQEILKEIDRKLLNYDFLDMIQSKELRKQMKNYDTSEANKQNISQNINMKPFNKNDPKNKKIPILKLSQLALIEDSL